MKLIKLTSLLFLLSFYNNVFSQNCLPNGFSFFTQSQVDNFPILYPGCTEIEGYVLLGPELTNLEGLSNITMIGGYLQLSGNTNLTNLEGLENLTSIGGDLNIHSNTALINLEGLGNINTLNGNLGIQNNVSLTNLLGLDNLTSIAGEFTLQFNGLINLSGLGNLSFIGSRLMIEGNDNLQTLDGLENLTQINQDFFIAANPILADIYAISNLNINEVAFFGIIDNPLLATCSLGNICNYLETTLGTLALISNNAPGCNNVEEIQFECSNFHQLYFPIFYDLNENGILDVGEPFYGEASVNILPEGMTAYSNQNNGGFVLLTDGTYTVEYNEEGTPNWGLTTSTSYIVELNNDNHIDTVYFGIHPLNDVSEFNTVINAPFARCNEWVPFTVTSINHGTTIASGTSWLQVDTNIVEVEYIELPDTIIAPNMYGWHFNNLYPGQSISNSIELKMLDETFIGTFLHFEAWTNFADINGEHLSRYFYYDTEIQCSYDPNDKQVNPLRMNGYALFEEALTYTVRFQNTGNAEAYDVVIRDTLDANLDPTSFRVISSSHDDVLSTTMDDDRFLTFSFNDIFLPDSTTNFDASQGYVMYQVRTKEGIPEETEVKNTASIYFDYNPPIVTNTTENIMLSTFDFDEDGFELFVDCDDKDETVNPAAAEIPNNGVDEDCDGEDLTTGVETLNASSIRVQPNPTNGKFLVETDNQETIQVELRNYSGQIILQENFQNQQWMDLTNFPSGVYIMKIQTDKGMLTKRIVKM